MLVPELMASYIFIVALVFGILVLTQIWQNKPTPKLLVVCHGFAGILGLGILWIHILNGNDAHLLLISAVLFSIAVLGGFILFTLDLTHHRIPKILALVHPLIALSALIVLVVYLLR